MRNTTGDRIGLRAAFGCDSFGVQMGHGIAVGPRGRLRAQKQVTGKAPGVVRYLTKKPEAARSSRRVDRVEALFPLGAG